MKTVVTILQLLCGLAIILIVLFQSGKSQGLSGAIGGIADSYLSKSKAKSVDAKLAKATKWVGAVFVVLTLVLNCMVAAGLYAKILPRKADILWMSAFFLVQKTLSFGQEGFRSEPCICARCARTNTLSPRKVFFATYTPQKTDWIFFAASEPRTLRGLATSQRQRL